ncbi:MAG: MmcQ/YjbR family DNA-binding protein [Pseudomonadota bacterium]
MTPEEFRALALSMPEAVESGHMGKADFRVRKKIFATLDEAADEAAGVGTLKLDAGLQEAMRERLGAPVYAANGAWGRNGWTKLAIAALSPDEVAPWMREAWLLTAPVTLRRQHEDDE